jgi:hypothetical protein
MVYKRYVNIISLIDKEGQVTPLILLWDNGTKYAIDKIHEIRKAVSVVGGGGILYRCQIMGQERKLFYEKNRWFIESLHP